MGKSSHARSSNRKSSLSKNCLQIGIQVPLRIFLIGLKYIKSSLRELNVYIRSLGITESLSMNALCMRKLESKIVVLR